MFLLWILKKGWKTQKTWYILDSGSTLSKKYRNNSMVPTSIVINLCSWDFIDIENSFITFTGISIRLVQGFTIIRWNTKYYPQRFEKVRIPPLQDIELSRITNSVIVVTFYREMQHISKLFAKFLDFTNMSFTFVRKG